MSKAVMPISVPTGQVFSHRLAVFADEDPALQAILSSSLHVIWAVKYSPTLETRVHYAPSNVFVTFPRPPSNENLTAHGKELQKVRESIMHDHGIGLTALYNLVNDPEAGRSWMVNHIREIHATIDQELVSAYGWEDIPLSHGFHAYHRMMRFSIGPAARVKFLDRLLEENLRRAALQGDVGGLVQDDDVTDELADE
jgi:hypothetical protein